MICHSQTRAAQEPDASIVGDRARLLRTRSNYLELIPATASKGAALRALGFNCRGDRRRVARCGRGSPRSSPIRVIVFAATLT